MAPHRPVLKFFSQSARRGAGVTVASVLVAVMLTVACDPPPEQQPPVSCAGTGNTAHRGIAYKQVAGVSPSLLSLDLYEPIRDSRCGPAPIVVYIHGGGFIQGDKGNQIANKVNLFTKQGWVFASVNYRLSTDPPAGTARVRYPTHEQDVASAIKWISDHAGTYRGDPRRLLVLGHSSGAFLASLVSTDTSFLTNAGVDPHDVRCTVSLDTEYDITKQVAQGGTQEALYRNAFGNDPAVWKQGSPIEHTAAGQVRPSFLIFTQGALRRTSGSRDFGDRLQAGGTKANVIDVSPMSHEEINAAVGKPGDATVTPPLMDFFRSCVPAPK